MFDADILSTFPSSDGVSSRRARGRAAAGRGPEGRFANVSSRAGSTGGANNPFVALFDSVIWLSRAEVLGGRLWIFSGGSIVLLRYQEEAELFALAFSSSSGVLVRSWSAWMPPGRSSSSFSRPYTIRCRAGWGLATNDDDTMSR